MGKNRMFDYLNQLDQNNNKEWFTAHKIDFDKAKAEADAVFQSIYAAFGKEQELEPLKIYRIYRDIRFSTDKTPYKNHFSAHTGYKKPYKRGGIYFQIQPGNCFIGAGFWRPEKDDLLRIRREIEVSDELQKIVKSEAIIKIFGSIQGESVKTAPKGFNKDHERIELLKKKQFLFINHYTEAEVLKKNFPLKVTEALLTLQPFFDYMTEVLTTDENGVSLI